MNKHLSKLKFFYNFILLFILILNSKGEPEYITLRKSEITTIYIDYSKTIRVDNEQTNKKNKGGFLINILSIDFEVNIENVQEKEIKKLAHYNYNAFSLFFEKGNNFFIN